MNIFDDNVSIPTLEELNNLCENKGIFPIELDYSSMVMENNPIPFLRIKLPIEKFIDYLNFQNVKTIFYVYTLYEIYDFQIDKEDLEATILENEEIMEKIEEYNDSISENYDFSRPKCFYAFALVNNSKIGIIIEDDWLENDEGKYTICFPEDALNNILYPTQEEFEKHLREEEENQKKRQELFKKTFFEFLVKDKRFTMCTTIKSRKEYVLTLQQNEPELVKQLEELNGIWNPYEYEIFVEKTWKLFKQKVYKYSESIGQIL